MNRIFLMIALPLSVGSCAQRQQTLTRADLMQCRAKNGFESRAPFGAPICQIAYPDAGKSCAGKEDCLGRCLQTLDGLPSGPPPPVGTPASGKCEALHQTFGCFALVESGKIAEPGICED